VPTDVAAYRLAGEALVLHANQIAERWKAAVRADSLHSSHARLPDLLLTHHLAALLADLAEALTTCADGGSLDSGSSIGRRRRGLKIGQLRGLVHYDAADLYLEFQHLRRQLWRFFRQELDWGREEAFDVMLTMDQLLDEVVGASLRGLAEAQLKERRP
jgi:hypothetical protein